MRFDNFDEVLEFFLNNGFTKDKSRFTHLRQVEKVTEYPIYMKLQFNGPDERCMGFGEEYVIVDTNSVKETKTAVIEQFNVLKKAIKEFDILLEK